jgi:large subunit ribosomal protein L10
VTESVTMILADYKGLTVYEMEDLRRKVREVGGQVSVIKNTLAKVALNDLEIDALDGDLNGQIAFVFSKADAVVGTKAAFDFSRGKKNFKLVAGFFDGHRLSSEQVLELAKLPSRDELQGRFVGLLIAPITDFVGTLQAPHREFIGTLEARAKKLTEEAA